MSGKGLEPGQLFSTALQSPPARSVLWVAEAADPDSIALMDLH